MRLAKVLWCRVAKFSFGGGGGANIGLYDLLSLRSRGQVQEGKRGSLRGIVALEKIWQCMPTIENMFSQSSWNNAYFCQHMKKC